MGKLLGDGDVVDVAVVESESEDGVRHVGHFQKVCGIILEIGVENDGNDGKDDLPRFLVSAGDTVPNMLKNRETDDAVFAGKPVPLVHVAEFRGLSIAGAADIEGAAVDAFAKPEVKQSDAEGRGVFLEEFPQVVFKVVEDIVHVQVLYNGASCAVQNREEIILVLFKRIIAFQEFCYKIINVVHSMPELRLAQPRPVTKQL